MVPKARGARSAGSPPWPTKNEGGTCRVTTCQTPSAPSAAAPATKQASSPMISARVRTMLTTIMKPSSATLQRAISARPALNEVATARLTTITTR